MVKNPPANAGDMGLIPETGRSPEKEVATHSSILSWEIPWMRRLAGYTLGVAKESDTTQRLSNSFHSATSLHQLNSAGDEQSAVPGVEESTASKPHRAPALVEQRLQC